MTKEIIDHRKITGFWCVWMEGREWPFWYYGRDAAAGAAVTLAKANPGRRVMLCNLCVDETFMLPDKLVRERA